MEFFSDFNYDDLEEINMSGGGNTEVPEPGDGLNIQMSEEIKKGETMEAQNAEALSNELNKDPSTNIDRDAELKFNPNLISVFGLTLAIIGFFIGIKDTYSKGGTYKFLKEKHRLSPEKIVDDILNEYKKING